MIHFTCDMCGCAMFTDDDRYIVCIDIRPADDSFALTEEDIDEDNLEKISELLQSEEEACGHLKDIETISMRLDLCGSCREKYRRDPLNRRAVANVDFSEN